MRAGNEGPVSRRKRTTKVMTTMENIGVAGLQFKIGWSQKASWRRHIKEVKDQAM